MEATQSSLETELVQLKIAVCKSDAVLKSGYEEVRHLSALKALGSEAE